MKNKKGIAFYIFFLLIAVGFVAVGLLLPPRPRMTQDDNEKPPAAVLRAQEGEDETG